MNPRVRQLLLDMHEACWKVAQNSTADAIDNVTGSLDELAEVLGIELPSPESYDEDEEAV